MKNKIVFVTGASSGIGAATAMAFAGAGARVLLCARRIDALERMKPELDAAGAAETHFLQLDVSDSAAVAAAMNALPPEWKEIDVLVNNAGLSRGFTKLYLDDAQDWEEMIDTNVKGLLYVTRAVVPGMVERDRGHVVNLGSIAAHMVYPNGAVYCATKAAELAITQGLKQDLLGSSVRVTTVDPGMVITDFSKVRFRGDEARADKMYQGVNPLLPEDVADAILWVATRPAHVNIQEIILTCVDQVNPYMLNRRAT